MYSHYGLVTLPRSLPDSALSVGEPPIKILPHFHVLGVKDEPLVGIGAGLLECFPCLFFVLPADVPPLDVRPFLRLTLPRVFLRAFRRIAPFGMGSS